MYGTGTWYGTRYRYQWLPNLQAYPLVHAGTQKKTFVQPKKLKNHMELSKKPPEEFDPEDLRVEFERECDNGNAGACFSLGEWYQVIKRDYAKAAELFEENCEKRNFGNSCFGLGALYSAGRGRERDFTKARALFKKACSLGHTRGCDIHGATCLDKKISEAAGTKQDFVGAQKSFASACSREYAPSCFRLGQMHLKGQLSSDGKPDAASSHAFMKRACDLGAPNGCHTLAVMYKNGDSVTQDDRKYKYYADLTRELVKATGARMGATSVTGV
jgi:TPR repeat protein